MVRRPSRVKAKWRPDSLLEEVIGENSQFDDKMRFILKNLVSYSTGA